MKNAPIYRTLLLATLFYAFKADAKIWRVNNTGVSADFSTAQSANDAGQVANGDTLHFEPSGLSYGNLNISKRLVMIGNGYFLGSTVKNANPNLQANIAASKLGNVRFIAGSSNSVMMGMTCDIVYFGDAGQVININFRRNFCSNLLMAQDGTNNTLIAQNFITGFISGGAGAHTNLAIIDNIIGYNVSFNNDDNGIFSNNLIGANGQVSGFLNLVGFTVRNNIRLANPAAQNIVLTSCIVQNNMDCTGNFGFGTTENNVGDIDMSNVFAGWPDMGSSSFDGRFALKDGSPAAGTGYSGADMGAILRPSNTSNNMADTYVLSGMPNIPSIFKLDAPGTVSTSTLNITVSAKSNN